MGKVLTKLIDEATMAAATATGTYRRISEHQGKLKKLRDELVKFRKQNSKKIDKMFEDEIREFSDGFAKLNRQYYKDYDNFGQQVDKIRIAVGNLHGHVLEREKKNRWGKRESTKEARELVKTLNATYNDLWKKVKEVKHIG